MSGTIESDKGNVKVEIHNVFRVLLSIILCFPIIAVLLILLTEQEEQSLTFILAVIGQVFIIRYVFIGLAFKILSKQSLNRLQDVLDVEWIKN